LSLQLPVLKCALKDLPTEGRIVIPTQGDRVSLRTVLLFK
jgi:hypothetical protein